MSEQRDPRPGDIIASYGRLSLSFSHLWKSITDSAVAAGIMGFQFWEGYGLPASRSTHVIYYVGTLTERSVWDAYRDGRIGSLTAVALLQQPRRHDWCFSMTWPVGVWESWEEAQRLRPGYKILEWAGGAPGPDPAMVARHLWPLIGRGYDEYQLFGILIHGLIGLDPTIYKHWVDRGGERTVCSGAIASALEKARREAEDAGQPAWPRLMGGMHVERVPPAAFWSKPRGATWEPPYRVA